MQTRIEAFIDLIENSGYTISELGFSTGTTLSDTEKISIVTKQPFPEELKLFLTYINGQRNHDFYFLPDQVALLSVAEIVREWEEQQKYADDMKEFYNMYHCDDKIRNVIYHKTRIPFALQPGFGFVAIDNDPGPNGIKGQVIYLKTESSFVVLADSFEDFIDHYIDCMHRGTLKFVEEEEGYLNKFRLLPHTGRNDGDAFAEIFGRL